MSEMGDTAVRQPDRFEIHWVLGCIGDVLRQQLVTFWLTEGALSDADEAWRRTFEVACVLQDRSRNEIAGVCTVAIRLDDKGRSYGFVRIFIRPESRLLGLNFRLMEHMVAGFSAIAQQQGAPKRLIATIENRKLERRGAQRLLERLGFVRTGTAPNGEMVIERPLVA